MLHIIISWKIIYQIEEKMEAKPVATSSEDVDVMYRKG
jgi:hypothetical protein